MMFAHYRLRILLFALVLTPVWTSASKAGDAQTHFFSLGIGDLQAEIADARTKGKQALLIMFEQEGCPACLSMKRDVLSRKDVQDFFARHFVNIALDTNGSVPISDFGGRDTTEKAYAQTANVKGTPTFIFYDLTGAPIVRVTGAVKADEFLMLGRFVATDAYKTRSLAQFRRGDGTSR